MDIGTGKDLADYEVAGERIAVHLVDIADPGYEYNLFEFQRDFRAALLDITGRKKIPILCGGTGLYLESVLKGYELYPVKPDPEYEKLLSGKTDEELRVILQSLRSLHNTTDLLDRERLIRAIIIAGQTSVKAGTSGFGPVPSLVIGIQMERSELLKRISGRLEDRLQHGMISEVEGLLKKGYSPAQLKFYGLEYKFVTRFLEGELTYEEMSEGLNIAIRQFAKRQMTWFRRMERSGTHIHWLDGRLDMEVNVNEVLERVK